MLSKVWFLFSESTILTKVTASFVRSREIIQNANVANFARRALTLTRSPQPEERSRGRAAKFAVRLWSSPAAGADLVIPICNRLFFCWKLQKILRIVEVNIPCICVYVCLISFSRFSVVVFLFYFRFYFYCLQTTARVC